MHKLLFIGLVGSWILAFGLAAPAQAMRPASNADLRACLGKWVAGTICGDTHTLCTGTLPATGQCALPIAKYGDHCNCDPSGPSDNYACNTTEAGFSCLPGSTYCVRWVQTTCNFYNGSGDLFCDDTLQTKFDANDGSRTSCGIKPS